MNIELPGLNGKQPKKIFSTPNLFFSMSSSNIEIEARFINIDKAEIIQKLLQLGAVDQGEAHLQEIKLFSTIKAANGSLRKESLSVYVKPVRRLP